ncbi:class I SAM-dependent methyltransferase [Mesorhizobium sp. M7A.F.Ca.CA.001.07.2.1]|nr:class I SAM-dependent methyltransferase [Mesorhizobium sp. M7A.F.Ca.CA.001.10.2.1]RUX81402.1 class I SAM-dependent methyltransferase [Mesorhizobium sp. M7A.F.Ca.CA.004.08.2.1]RUX89426.1 class I SAM-dependent methyltransferase [Mesorhizobium sp. M7A.F.Ca.CA.004.08.1.1]RUY07945.1 class I SAM-dependent methyltransferase [Mesorhizobium sp. M7A.F.Ca.CA.004.04.1.1]RUY30102.1 class I SAM-dependent methyltransferase [Mesorhizobium sp. M7A.F.Ca.CA.004.12.1.1]RUY57068.1 class I SAM-dependent methyltr
MLARKPSTFQPQRPVYEPSLLKLPAVPQADLDVHPIDWSGLNARFMNPGELEVLVALARSVAPKVAIEFGVNEGRTAKALLRNVVTIERYVGIDVPQGYVTDKIVQRREVPQQPAHLALDDSRFRLLIARHGSHDLLIDDLPECDFAFIDGDHGARGVMQDQFLALNRVRKGGMIVYHDYHARGTVDVQAVLEELHKSGRRLIQHVEGTWLAFMRV